MSAAARETKKRFCGPLRDRLVSTAIMTKMLPTIVMRIMSVIAVAKAAVASGVYGGSLMLRLAIVPAPLPLLPERLSSREHALSMTATTLLDLQMEAD